MTKQELYEQFILELDRSLVIDDKTREYWVKNFKTLPVSAVDFFYRQLLVANRHVDTMVAVGIDADPSLAEQIVQKGKIVKKKALKFQESESAQEENPEEFLKASLT